LDVADQLLNRAKAKGADAADVILAESLSVSSTVRLGALEDVERSEGLDLGLRVFVGASQAIVSTSDLGENSLEETATSAVAMAKAAPPDPNAGLPEQASSAPNAESLELYDDFSPSADALKEQAAEAEAAALAVQGVSNSIGASASHGVTGVVMAASNGFSGSYRRSSFSVSCAVLAGEGTAMERDYDYSSKVHHEDLESASEIGKTAGERAVSRLGGRKMPTSQVPVVYHPRVASQLLSNLASAISGSAIARGTSFLKERLGEAVFPDHITIVDDPLLKRGTRSRPFDAEGQLAEVLNLIDGGVLTTWLLDSRTAKQLGLKTNGRASRGVSSGPSPGSTNLYMQPGNVSAEDLISDIADGFYVMGLMGRGGSVVTGDYSEGANGFWIENGKITHPVTEVTIAGNLADMYQALTPADDLEFKGAVNAPTLRIEGMTVAGS
ncbi:MAG: TldD/PmbA family protein, partial [Rhizobiales bacterium]|nr:TldD/PmbA family protein [Hyphomicrobiales bacterium]